MLYNLITIVLINSHLKKSTTFLSWIFCCKRSMVFKTHKHLIAAQSKYLQPLSTPNIFNTYFHRLVLSIIFLFKIHILVIQRLQQLNCTFLLFEYLRKYRLGYLLKNAVFGIIHHFLCHVGISNS